LLFLGGPIVMHKTPANVAIETSQSFTTSVVVRELGNHGFEFRLSFAVRFLRIVSATELLLYDREAMVSESRGSTDGGRSAWRRNWFPEPQALAQRNLRLLEPSREVKQIAKIGVGIGQFDPVGFNTGRLNRQPSQKRDRAAESRLCLWLAFQIDVDVAYFPVRSTQAIAFLRIG